MLAPLAGASMWRASSSIGYWPLSRLGPNMQDSIVHDLERRHRFPFFDKRPSSLPKGKRFPPLIKAAVTQCEMMVVVVSEEYFTSKWPMIELHAFMQASVTNPKLKILPLFFGLNQKEFSNIQRQKRWFKVWEKMAEVDVQGRIKVDEWKECLKLIDPFNGMVYNRDSKEVVAYRKAIVSNICKALPLDIKLDERHVQGRSKLCQVVRQHLENNPNSKTKHGVCVMGLHGVGGIGKTQLCKIMCNEMEREFEGKVCHLELGNQSKHELVKKALIALTNTSVEVVEEVGKDKCQDILCKNMIWKQKTFTMIDNVWDDFDSLGQANMFLGAPFVKGSCVIVTSRFKKTLLSLNINENACFEMPELDKDNAKNLFLYYAANGKTFENKEDIDAIEECIKSCYYGKGDNQSSHYHPLSLKALGVFLQYGGKGPCVWVKDLQKLKVSSYVREPKNPLFTILRSNFDRLPAREQELFMDVSVFSPTKPEYKHCVDMMNWLCLVHDEEKDVIEDWLQHLVDSALLEGVDMSSGKVSMHDLYREFAELEAKGKLAALDMEKRRWVYAEDAFPTELNKEPTWSCWESLTRLSISESWTEIMKRYRTGKESNTNEPIMSLWSTVKPFPIPTEAPAKATIAAPAFKWKYCTKLVVLQLERLTKLCGVLNLEGLIGLRSLSVDLYDPSTFDSIEGLESLENLIFFRMVGGEHLRRKGPEDNVPMVGHLPKALQVLEVFGRDQRPVLLMGNVLALCTNLVILKLIHVSAPDLDLKNCTSLQEVELQEVERLRVLKGFALELGSSLRSLMICDCKDLEGVWGLSHLVGLQSLILGSKKYISYLPSLSRLTQLRRLSCYALNMHAVQGLDDLVGLESLSLTNCHHLSNLPSLSGLQSLRKLQIARLGISEIPNLSGLKQLEVVDASGNSRLTSMQGIGDLPAVESITLYWCESLCRLSDMSKLTNLKYLDRRGSAVVLHEDDMRMLQRLPLLEPILVAASEKYDHKKRCFGFPTYLLDFRRHKILYRLCEKRLSPYRGPLKGFQVCPGQTCTQSGWKEKDLHIPPTCYPVGQGFKVRDVEEIWKLVPATKS